MTEKTSPHKVSRMLELYFQGYSQSDIAEKINVNQSTVSLHINRFKTMAALIDRLWCKTEVGGVARYENDHYQQISQDIANVPGNPWFICTMWVAQYHIARAQSIGDLKPALQIFTWAKHCALPSGVVAEQVHPYNCAPLNVSPLTWSHAAVVIAIHEYIDKYHELQAQLHHRQKGI